MNPNNSSLKILADEYEKLSSWNKPLPDDDYHRELRDEVFETLNYEKIEPLTQGIKLYAKSPMNDPAMIQGIYDQYKSKLQAINNVRDRLSKTKDPNQMKNMLKMIKEMRLSDKNGFVYGRVKVHKGHIDGIERSFEDVEKCFEMMKIPKVPDVTDNYKVLLETQLKQFGRLYVQYKTAFNNFKNRICGSRWNVEGSEVFCRLKDIEFEIFKHFEEKCENLSKIKDLFQLTLKELSGPTLSLKSAEDKSREIAKYIRRMLDPNVLVFGNRFNILGSAGAAGNKKQTKFRGGAQDMLNDIGKLVLVAFIIVMLIIIVCKFLGISRSKPDPINEVNIVHRIADPNASSGSFGI